jgi:2-phospho-L-lactate guanylyltransferase
MLNDTLAAARSCSSVCHLVVVTADEELAATAHLEGAEVLREAAAEDLNGSFRAAAVQVGAIDDTLSLAFLPADLPAATTPELELALIRAERFPSAVLADSNRVGTVLLAVAAGTTTSLCFGPSSYRAHRAAGAHRIYECGLGGLRRDVDTLGDLIVARQIGLGQHTGSVVDDLAPPLHHQTNTALLLT